MDSITTPETEHLATVGQPHPAHGYGARFAAVCPCGWEGSDRWSHNVADANRLFAEAEADAAAHRNAIHLDVDTPYPTFEDYNASCPTDVTSVHAPTRAGDMKRYTAYNPDDTAEPVMVDVVIVRGIWAIIVAWDLYGTAVTDIRPANEILYVTT